MTRISTRRLPVCKTSCPGPWHPTSADGEYTRRNSEGRRKLRPSANAISSTRDFWCSVIAVGTRSALMGCGSGHRLVGDALEIDAALEYLHQHGLERGLAAELDNALRLVPARGQDQRDRRIERRHRAQRERRHPAVLLHVEPGRAHGDGTRQPGQQLEPSVYIAVLRRHQPAQLGQHELLAIAGAHTDQLTVGEALAGLIRLAHHVHALRAFVLDLPMLVEEALGVAVLVFLARADAPESGDLLALLLRELGLLVRRFGHAAGDVVVDARELAAGLRRRARRAALHHARRLRLAPLAIKVDQQLLARGLHAILAERELGRRLALAH